jgi:isopenicillin N synthase-like dioxygenase
MSPEKPDQTRGPQASSPQFARYDQVGKADYHLAEAADGPDAFDENFRFTTCDMGRFLHGDAADRAAFSQELGEAMASIGFAILQGHGVDPQLFSDAERWVELLFSATPLEHKLRFRAARHGSVSEGYFPIKETSDIHPDLVEGWVFGRRAFDFDQDPGQAPRGQADGYDVRAFWPRPELESCFRRLIQAQLPLFLPIMQSVLSFLGCDAHLYDTRLARPDFGQRLNYYPPLSRADTQRQAGRLLGHEDVNTTLTYLQVAKFERNAAHSPLDTLYNWEL